MSTYDPVLASLSLLVAIFASYAALDLCSHAQSPPNGRDVSDLVLPQGVWNRRLWLLAAAVAFGFGVWAMHFVAMLAYRGLMPLSYDIRLTVLSLLLAITASAISFNLVHRQELDLPRLVLSGTMMGGGIASMHYTGMAAMQTNGHLHFQPLLTTLSIVIAITAATLALRLTFTSVHKFLAALAMAAAITATHYSGMAATLMDVSEMDTGMARQGVDASIRTSIGITIAVSACMIVALALIASFLDRHHSLREAEVLRQSAERFRTLYRHAPIPLHCTDINNALTEVSDRWLELLDLSRETVIGRSLSCFMPPASAQEYLTRIHPQLLQEGSLNDQELQIMRRDGTVLDVLLSSHAERDTTTGRVVRIVGGLVDITMRKRTEEAFRHAQKMDALGQMTGGIAHDFNNLLAAILGALEIATARVHDPRATRMLDVATQAAQRGARLTSQMLAFSRRQNLTMQPVAPNIIITGLRDMLERMIGPLVELRFELAQDAWSALADPVQLDVALINLAVNARDAMPTGGVLTIRTFNATLGDTSGLQDHIDTDYAAIAVADNGHGIPGEILSQVFEPFFTTKAPGQGTGLGLSMVHGFVTQAGGRVDITSCPEHGTTVTLYLPRTDATRISTASPPQTTVPDRALTLLLVDDDDSVRTTVRAMLDQAGHIVVEAKNGTEALHLLQHNHFDALVADYAMPVMTGVQLANAVEQICPELPVVIMTGYVEGDVLQNWPSDHHRTLNKPFRASALLTTIWAAIDPHLLDQHTLTAPTDEPPLQSTSLS